MWLNNGYWNGEQIIPKTWIQNCIIPDPREHNKYFYNNNIGIGPLKYSTFYAVGLYGQFLYVYPKKNIIILRFGDTDFNYHPNYWTNTFLQIIDEIEAMKK